MMAEGLKSINRRNTLLDELKGHPLVDGRLTDGAIGNIIDALLAVCESEGGEK